jgi:hypothetical protein
VNTRIALSQRQRMGALVMDALSVPIALVAATVLTACLYPDETIADGLVIAALGWQAATLVCGGASGRSLGMRACRWPQPVPPFSHPAVVGTLEVVGLAAVVALVPLSQMLEDVFDEAAGVGSALILLYVVLNAQLLNASGRSLMRRMFEAVKP